MKYTPVFIIDSQSIHLAKITVMDFHLEEIISFQRCYTLERCRLSQRLGLPVEIGAELVDLITFAVEDLGHHSRISQVTAS